MGLFRVLVRLFAGRGRPQSHRTTTEPLQPLSFGRRRRRALFRPHRSTVPQPLPDETVLQGRCWVIDGDTIVINNIRLRLAGIDAPELDHPWGQQSKWALVQLCKGQTVTARIKPELSYDRMVAECFLPDGRDLAAELVRMWLSSGLAQILWRQVSAPRAGRCPTQALARSRLANAACFECRTIVSNRHLRMPSAIRCLPWSRVVVRGSAFWVVATSPRRAALEAHTGRGVGAVVRPRWS